MQGRRCRLVLGLTFAAAAACGGKAPPATPLGNTEGASTIEPPVRVDPAGSLGTLALATRVSKDGGGPYWIPFTDVAPVLAPRETGVAAGTRYTVVPQDGSSPVTLTGGPPVTIKYGCDGNTTEFLPLGTKDDCLVAPGVVWVLPAEPPVSWMPRGLPLVETDVDPAHRSWTAGALQLDLTRADDTHAELVVENAGARRYRQAVEMYFMDGADRAPLDLSQGPSPGIPFPQAVFAFSPSGPYLLVLDTSGYEGVGFQTIFIGDGVTESSRTIDAMATGLYYCAF